LPKKVYLAELSTPTETKKVAVKMLRGTASPNDKVALLGLHSYVFDNVLHSSFSSFPLHHLFFKNYVFPPPPRCFSFPQAEFVAECETMPRLQHENLVRLLGVAIQQRPWL
jgi:hypothetical protein